MFNRQEAADFLNKVCKEMLERGDLDALAEIYHKDAIGHSNQGDFNYSDIVKRIRLLNEYCENKKRFEVIDFYIVDNLIFGQTRQTWLSPKDSSLCEAYVFFTYRIVDAKVKEVWLMTSGDTTTYLDANEKFDNFLNRFEVSSVGKQAFFKYLEDFSYLFQKDKISFTVREEEILFYYLRGHTAKEIAKEMDISHRTVESHIANIFEKTGCTSKAELRIKLFP